MVGLRSPRCRRVTILAGLPALAALVLLPLLLLGGCGDILPGRDDEGLPRRPAGEIGGLWTEAIDREPQTFDPAYAVTLLDSRIVSLLFSGLVALTPGGNLVPDLAAAWDIADDGLTYTFTLRNNIKFHNGQPVTAADVVYSFSRLLSPNTASPRAWVLYPIAGAQAFHTGLAAELTGVEALAEKTVRITLERPMAQFLYRLTMPAAAIVATDDGADGPPGTGPFQLHTWQPGQELVLVRHDEYHWGPTYLDGVRLRLLPDRADMLAAFRAGELHTAELSAAELRHLTDTMGWSGPLQKVTLPAVYYLALNNQQSPLTDPLVRRAIHHAIDRAALLQEGMPLGSVLARGAVPPGLPGYNPDRALPAYDPLQARQLLVQAGLDDGFTLTILQGPAPAWQEIGRALGEMLAPVGITVELQTLANREFYAAVDGEGDPQAFIISWYGDYPDAENFLYPLFHSDFWGAGGNRARFASPEVDLLLTELPTVADPAQRVDLYRQVEDAVFRDVPWVPLFHPVRYHVMQPGVKNYKPVGYYQAQRLWSVWLEQGAPADG